MASLAYAEALSAAVRIEENGAAFYRRAAAEAIDPGAAETFSTLAKWEDEHRGYFRALAMAQEQRESIFRTDPKGEFAARVRDMADAGVYDLTRDVSAFFGGRRTQREAIKFAIGIEKDSVIFYLGLQEVMAEGEEALKVGGIIKEEMRHISILSALLKRLKD